MKCFLAFAIVCVGALLTGCGGGSGKQATSATARYVIADAGGDFGSSQAYGLNNKGQVIARGSGRSGPIPPDTGVPGGNIEMSYLYVNGAVTKLPAAALLDINDMGQIVGENGVYQNNTLTPLPGLIPPSPSGATFNASATAINNQGQVVGYALPGTASQSGFYSHAILYDKGQLTDLGTLDSTYSRAAAINNQGQVVGSASIGPVVVGMASLYHAFLWQNGTISDLGAPEGGSSEARAINDNGQIVGLAVHADGSVHAALWQNNVMQDLGVSGFARAINNAGQVVGSMNVTTGVGVTAQHHAFLYENGRSVDLNTQLPAASGWELTEAADINDKGQICGTGIFQGTLHAFLLTPQ